jgi:hypothetical protein
MHISTVMMQTQDQEATVKAGREALAWQLHKEEAAARAALDSLKSVSARRAGGTTAAARQGAAQQLTSTSLLRCAVRCAAQHLILSCVCVSQGATLSKAREVGGKVLKQAVELSGEVGAGSGQVPG